MRLRAMGGSRACAWLFAFLLPLGAALTGALGATSQTRSEALRVCADPNNLPFTNRAEQGFENKLARLIARDLGTSVEYTWWPQRRGFIRNTLKAGHCDVVMGLPVGFEMAELTTPYYRSTYVFVTRAGSGLQNLDSLDDPRLRTLRIGLHAIGDDYANVPPAEALAARGITRNVAGYSIYGDYSKPNPPARLIDAVARGDVDVAIAWGPLGGYYAARAKPQLAVTPIRSSSQSRDIPLDYAIAMGVRHGDDALRARLQRSLDRHGRDIDMLLAQYHVPRTGSTALSGWRVFVTNERSGDVSVIDGERNVVVATVKLGKRPRGLQLAPDGEHLYIALSGSPIGGPNIDESKLPPPDKAADGIGVVDLATLRLERVLRGVSDPEQLAVGPDPHHLYVASEDSSTAIVLDARTGRVLHTLRVGHEPEGIALAPGGRWLYVASEADNEISVIDTTRDAVAGTIKVGARPRGIVFARTRPVAYVSCENDGTVSILDTKRRAVTGRIALPIPGARPMGMALSPDDAKLYVATGRAGKVIAIDTKTERTTGVVDVGQRPWGVALGPDGRFLYTANGPSNDVAVVDTATFAVIKHISVGTSPWGALAVSQNATPVSTVHD